MPKMGSIFYTSWGPVGKGIPPGPAPTLACLLYSTGWQEGDERKGCSGEYVDMFTQENRHRGTPLGTMGQVHSPTKLSSIDKGAKQPCPGPAQPSPPLPPAPEGTDQVLFPAAEA